MQADTIAVRPASPKAVRDLSHDPGRWANSLLCQGCADARRCGGIAAKSGNGYCYDHCCGGKEGCQTVCRNNPLFSDQIREIGGFDLENTPRAAVVPHPPLRGVAPLILHGRKRESPVFAPIVALKLRDVVNFRTGQLRHADRSSLANALKIRTDAHLIVTGIEQDRFVEPWWSLGRDRRAPLLRELAKLGIALVTPPNFSLFCDQPRPSDFSAMKRIARVQSEFQAAGIACSLHAHIRNETDSARWASFVAGRPEITSIAYEFTTGAGREPVRRMQVEHLIRLAKVADRPMDLVLRGDTGVVTELVGVYRHLVYIDTNAFMKTVNRQKAVRTGNEGLTWKANKTPKDVPLDALLQHNVDEVTLAGRQMLTRSV